MEKRSKILQRKHREQPQQHHMSNPPLLEENKLDEEDYDKWRVINMQYRALFKNKDDVTFEDRHLPSVSAEVFEKKPVPKSVRTADNKIDQRYLTNKLLDFEKKQNEKIKKPALLIQSTEEILRQLPKGESLLEEAEIAASKKIGISDDPEELLRETVDTMHLKQVQRMESAYLEVYNSLTKDIEDFEIKNADIEQKIRKFSFQANTENEELEEVRKHAEKVRDLETKREEAYKENQLMEETIALLQQDIDEMASGMKEKQFRLHDEIFQYKEKVNMIDTQKVESLEYECKELYRENKEIEMDIGKLEKLWKGENVDFKKIMEELDENSAVIRKELREITVSRAVIRQERENIRKRVKEVEEERVKYLKASQQTKHKDQRYLYMYVDNLLTDASRRIRMVLDGSFDERQTENTIRSQIEENFSTPSSLDEVNPSLKEKRDTLAYLKDKHDNAANFSEKEAVLEVTDLVKTYKKVENKALMQSLNSISKLSPIRKVSPARESSLSSLSKLREITDKVVKPKSRRTPSASSKGSKSSMDLTEVEERKLEHLQYLKLKGKIKK